MYERVPSAKLETLVEILRHHLAEDGAPGKVPSRINEHAIAEFDPPQQQRQRQELLQRQQGRERAGQKRQDEDEEREQDDETPALGPDKIIIYASFPSAFYLLYLVSPKLMR